MDPSKCGKLDPAKQKVEDRLALFTTSRTTLKKGRRARGVRYGGKGLRAYRQYEKTSERRISPKPRLLTTLEPWKHPMNPWMHVPHLLP